MAYEQVVSGFREVQGTSQGVQYHRRKNGDRETNYLDSLDDDPRYSDSATAIAVNVTQSLTSDDTPAIAPSFSDSVIGIKEDFKTYSGSEKY